MRNELISRIISLFTSFVEGTEDESLLESIDSKLTALEEKMKSTKATFKKTNAFDLTKLSLDDLERRVNAMEYSNYDELATLVKSKMTRVVGNLDNLFLSHKITKDTRDEMVDLLEAVTEGRNSNFNLNEVRKRCQKIKLLIMDKLEDLR
jgi:hypothetical protein